MRDDRQRPTGTYPEGQALNSFMTRRRWTGDGWHVLFLAATLLGIIALTALLSNVINGAFGYVAYKNEVEPEELLLSYYRDQVLNASEGMPFSEEEVAEAFRTRQTALGLMSYSTFVMNSEDLKLVSVRQEPTSEARLAWSPAGDGPTDSAPVDHAPVLVTGASNPFLADLSLQQLRMALTSAGQWSELEQSWPPVPIEVLIPSGEGYLLESFVSRAFPLSLEKTPVTDQIAILRASLSKGRVRALEAQTPLIQRSQAELAKLLTDEVVRPEIVGSWSLAESLFGRSEIEREVALITGARLNFRSWVNATFLTSPQSSRPEFAGVRTAIFGSVWVVLITVLFSVPLGIGAAIYLEEYGGQSRIAQIVETNINNLAGVPSIIYGMLGLALFVRALEPFTSGQMFGSAGAATASGRTVLSAGLTMGLLILPLIIINAREAIRAVPQSLRDAGYGLGATKWQTIQAHVLPNAVPGILTGVILAVSRAVGETAPLVVVGASTFIVIDPSGPFSKFTTLPIQIYQWTSRPQSEFQHLSAAAILVLLVLLIAMNATAVLLRNRFARSY